MRSSKLRAFLLTISLSGFAHSAAADVFGVDLQLHRAQALTGPDGVRYVGWPEDEAEKILFFFEQRVPLVEQQVAQQQEVLRLMEVQVQLGQAARSEVEVIAQRWREVAEAYKQSALERFLGRPEFWFVVGAIGGAVLARAL